MEKLSENHSASTKECQPWLVSEDNAAVQPAEYRKAGDLINTLPVTKGQRQQLSLLSPATVPALHSSFQLHTDDTIPYNTVSTRFIMEETLREIKKCRWAQA
jgi:hypothetical protein